MKKDKLIVVVNRPENKSPEDIAKLLSAAINREILTKKG